MLFYNPNIDQSQYVIATYWIKSKNADLATCAWNLAIGQSVGNPNVRNQWETEQLFEQSSCVIAHNKKDLQTLTEGEVKIAFPVINTDWDGEVQSFVKIRWVAKWILTHLTVADFVR